MTTNEFDEYKKTNDQQFEEMRQRSERAMAENLRLLKKIDRVDWSVVNQAENKLASILGEFQLSVDGLLEAIETDMKRWKT